MTRLVTVLALAALLAGMTCKKPEDGTALEMQMGLLILLLTDYTMNQNTCLSRPYQNASAGQSFGPFSSSFECFRFGASGPITAQMTTNGTALGRFSYWNPRWIAGPDADDATLSIPAGSDLWVLAGCQQSGCAPWSVQF